MPWNVKLIDIIVVVHCVVMICSRASICICQYLRLPVPASEHVGCVYGGDMTLEICS